MRRMTNRQRLLAVLHGRELDRVPFIQYDDCAAPNNEIWPVLGRNAIGRLRWIDACATATPSCRWSVEEFSREGLRGRRTTLRAPRGTLVEEALLEPTYGAASIKKHFVSGKDDWEVLLSCLKDVVVIADAERLAAADREIADDGLPHVAVQRTPYQQLWIQWVSLEDLVPALVDWPDITAAVIAELIRIQREIFRAVTRLPVPYIVFPDNITAPPIGTRYFRELCVPLYDELGEMLADRDVPVFVHMDGDLKPLWPAIGDSRVQGLDSLSPPPDNDTSTADAVRNWPRMKVFVNFPSSVHVQDPDRVYRVAQEILEQAGHTGRLSIQISENVPPGVWRRSFPAIVRAIDEFGKP